MTTGFASFYKSMRLQEVQASVFVGRFFNVCQVNRSQRLDLFGMVLFYVATGFKYYTRKLSNRDTRHG